MNEKISNKIKNIIMNLKSESTIKKFIPIIIICLLFIIVLWSFFAPVIIIGELSLNPYNFMIANKIDDVSFYNYDFLTVSYYVSKYFYTAFSYVTALSFLLILFFFITKRKNQYKNINYVMLVIVLFLFLSMLLGFNYVNMYNS